MRLKTIALIILVLLAIGAGIAFSIVYQQKQSEEKAGQLLLQAQAMLKEGAYEKAIALLSDLRERYPEYSGMHQVLFDLGQAYEKVAPQQAFQTWQLYLNQFPDALKTLEARLRSGWIALDLGKLEDAEEQFKMLVNSTRKSVQASAILGQGAIAESRGEMEQARTLFYRIINEYGEEAVCGDAMDRLSRINTEWFLSPRVTEFSQRYTIQPGDSLISIGAAFDTTAYLLKAINQMGSDQLRAGTRITVPKPGGIKITVDMPSKYLYVYSNMEGTEDRFLKRYQVGVAKYTERTPGGIYVIDDKMIDPTWYPPAGNVIPPGDPQNALGSRWMGFTRDNKDTSLGIHGTNAPETIGTDSSAGCIRMHNAEVEELFMLARQGTQVEIIK